jgi:hypothetical protein
MNILFYGNCQTFAIKETLNLPKEYNVYHVECFSSNILKKEQFTYILSICDFIITQPINDNYRDVDYLSTSYIINNCKKNCKIILFDSCYLNFYYFDLTYKMYNNNMLREPSDYHYNMMIECYKNNLPIDYYIENYVNNSNFKSTEELNIILNNSLNELKKRYGENVEKYCYNENIYIISTHDYIKNNYKDKLLFYSMNHPSKYVIQYICEELIQILKIKNTINYDKDILSGTKCIIYNCIQKVVNFNICEYSPFTSNKTNIKDITKLYYESYKKINYS